MKKPKREKKPCQKCKTRDAINTERYCLGCRSAVLAAGRSMTEPECAKINEMAGRPEVRWTHGIRDRGLRPSATV